MKISGPPRIYFVAPVGGGTIKIGLTGNVPSRFRALQASSPVALELLADAAGDQNAEFSIHQAFLAQRSHFEWFYPSAQLLALIAEVKAFKQLPPHFRPNSPQRNPLWNAGRYFRRTVAA